MKTSRGTVFYWRARNEKGQHEPVEVLVENGRTGGTYNGAKYHVRRHDGQTIEACRLSCQTIRRTAVPHVVLGGGKNSQLMVPAAVRCDSWDPFALNEHKTLTNLD
jgi:hypothetical protein